MTMEEAHNTFLMESRELLQEMEDSLLSLESNPDDMDLVNAIFRSIHTIKGSAGIFDFTAVESFTHVVETFFDLVRNGDIRIDSDMIAVLLQARDHIGLLVEEALDDSRSISEADRQHGEDLLMRLSGHMESVKSFDAPEFVAVENIEETEDRYENTQASENECWHISVRYNSEVLRHGMDPLSFIRYLAKLGDIRMLTTISENMPDASAFDPEQCYLGFEISFFSEGMSKESIYNVFEFVKDDCQLRVLAPYSHLGHYKELIDSLPESDEMIGQILVSSGALTQDELNLALSLQLADLEVTEGEKPEEAHSLLGEVVVQEKMVSQEVVDAAVSKQKEIKDKKVLQSKSIRVDAQKLDKLINLVGELVIASAGANLKVQGLGDNAISESMSNMMHLVEDIRDSALRLRMVQIGETFNRFQRVVRDVSKELGKEIYLEISGAETELDKSVVEKIGDPLMHLVRNAMDHGIESPEVRLQKGKQRQGTLKLNAFHDSGSIVIEVIDDGKGLDKEKILAKAREKGLVGPETTLTDQEIHKLIFEAGFSTAAQVTNLSGRGVGMDVVRKNIEALRGVVDIHSENGSGTTIQIRLPLTLAIIDGFLVGVGDSSYVIPLDMVVECIEMEADQDGDHDFVDSNYISLRGEVLPFLRLNDLFEERVRNDVKQAIVVVQYGGHKAGMGVDNLLGEFQTVIKPLGKIFQRLQGVSGSTILGSGEVAIILDVPNLVQRAIQMTGRVGAGMRPASGDEHVLH